MAAGINSSITAIYSQRLSAGRRRRLDCDSTH